ncbi:hypothetical protein LCGC14_1754410 [marine sediment metagenome]|uniref:Uncharacterized protein n=1 Tax=marine sediment metagenome TaxID=412755 RepID=A0A0F9H2Z3_9ZZZZ
MSKSPFSKSPKSLIFLNSISSPITFGKRISLSFAKRQAAILSKDDVYFIFKDKIQKEKHKKCLTSLEVKNLDIYEISKLIF